MNAPAIPIIERLDPFLGIDDVDHWEALETEAIERGRELAFRGRRNPVCLIAAVWESFVEAQEARRRAFLRWKTIAAQARAAEESKKVAALALRDAIEAVRHSCEATPLAPSPSEPVSGSFRAAVALLKVARDASDVPHGFTPVLERLEKCARASMETETAAACALDALEKEDAALARARDAWRRAWDAVELAARAHPALHRGLFLRANRPLDRKGVPSMLPFFLLERMRGLVQRVMAPVRRSSASVKALLLATGAAITVTGVSFALVRLSGTPAKAPHGVSSGMHAGGRR